MKRIAIATTGGDAPGMNAAIRAITRLAISNNIQVIGFEAGWDGLEKNKYQTLTKRSVGGILDQGGTILRTSRSDVLRSEKGRETCAENLKLNDVDGFFVIGGNGSFAASQALSQHIDIPFIGIPGTIDNDVYGTDETIGFDTAVNNAVEQIDKIRDTANSHDRIFITEVMGRKNGFIALDVGIAVGATVILVPEEEVNFEEIFTTIKKNRAKGKKSGLIVSAEGVGDCYQLGKAIEANTESTVRINVLGYTQRGGNPTARSRLLANLFVKEGMNQILTDPSDKVITLTNGKVLAKDMADIVGKERKMDLDMLEYYRILAS